MHRTAGPAGKGRKGGAGGDDDLDLDLDEVPEDLYGGVDDQLRPEKPEEVRPGAGAGGCGKEAEGPGGRCKQGGAGCKVQAGTWKEGGGGLLDFLGPAKGQRGGGGGREGVASAEAAGRAAGAQGAQSRAASTSRHLHHTAPRHATRSVCPCNRPRQAEDWEHEFAPDDDDQDQGADEEYEDDPGGWSLGGLVPLWSGSCVAWFVGLSMEWL